MQPAMQPLGLCERSAELETVPQVSVVVPFFDEAANLPVLIARLRPVLDELGRAAEVVLVDDGSGDGSAAAAAAAIGDDRRFRVVRLAANHGKSAAIAAGRDHAKGGVIVTMDADMQDPPEAIPSFLQQLDHQHDVVAGWRVDRRAPWVRRWCSAMFNRCVRAVSGIAVHDMNCGMKAYRRDALDAIHLSRGMHRFTAILAEGSGFRVGEVRVPNRDRLSGKTKYGAGRYFEAALGLLGALYVRKPGRSPLMTFGAIGALLLLAALVGGIAFAIAGPVDVEPRFLVLLALTAAFVLGAALLVAGLVGELILHRLTQSRRRAREEPQYTLADARDGPPRRE
jgi:hypothetical protein